MKVEMIWYDRVDSTNLLCKEKAARGAEEGLVILANSQSAGRGRLGRSFFSPEGSGLYMSLLLRPRRSARDCTRLTALAAVAVCRAVRAQCSLSPRIKWVNDVYLGEKKLCGILTQAAASPRESVPEWMIVGIGINLVLPEGGFPEDIRSLATALYSSHPDPQKLRESMAKAVVTEFFRLYEEESFQAAAEEYRRLCFLKNRRVWVLRGEERFPALVLDLTEDLNLLLQDDQQNTFTLCSGEVSLQLQ